MSKDAAVKFVEQFLGSEALQAKMTAATSGKEGRAVDEAIAALGQAEGFDFTVDEAAAFSPRATLFLKQKSGGELTEAELAQVAGGGAIGGHNIGGGALEKIDPSMTSTASGIKTMFGG